MKNRKAELIGLYAHHLTLAWVFLFCNFLIQASCTSNPDYGTVQLLCLDRKGVPLDQVEITINDRNQKSDQYGFCQFRLPCDPEALTLSIEADKAGYQFMGPKRVYVIKGDSMRYALTFLSDQDHTSPDIISNNLTLEFINPDTKPDTTSIPHQTPPDTVPPEPKYATWKIESIPPEVELTILRNRNIIARGKTPFNKLLEHGIYRIEARSGLGYKPYYKDKVKLSADRNDTLKLEIIPVKIEFKTDPESAYVQLNSQYKGQTPLTFQLESDGLYFLEIEREGFQTYRDTIELRHTENRIKIGRQNQEIPPDRKIEHSQKIKGKSVNVVFKFTEDVKITIDGNLKNRRWEKEVQITGIEVGYHKIEIQYRKSDRRVTIERFFIEPKDKKVYENFNHESN